MKLRNKKTGEIVDLVEGYIKDSYYGQKIEIKPVAISNKEGYMYNSLAELNEDWEDAPDTFYLIDGIGGVNEMNTDWDSSYKPKEIGNYFETREEAEQAVEKLKAWKRLKDKGFRFNNWAFNGDGANCADMVFDAKLKRLSALEADEMCEDLDLLFSQEDD